MKTKAKEKSDDKVKIFAYKTYQSPWVRVADPGPHDETYHSTLEEAIAEANKLQLRVGFVAYVDKIDLKAKRVLESTLIGSRFGGL